jgi:hypothetical protein
MSLTRFILGGLLCGFVCVFTTHAQWLLLKDFGIGENVSGQSIALSPTQPEQIYVSVNVIYHSSDKGNSWVKKDNWFGGRQVLVSGSSPPIVYTIAPRPFVRPPSEYLYVNREGSSYEMNIGKCFFVVLDPNDNKTIFVPGDSSYILRSIDDARTFERFSQMPVANPENSSVTDFAIARSRNSQMYASVNGPLYRSTDGGKTWEFSYDNIYSGLNTYEMSSLVTVDRIDENILYIANRKTGSLGVQRSLDGGTTWNDCGSPTIDEEYRHVFLDASGFSKGELFWAIYLEKSMKGRLLHSTDYGTTWFDYSRGLPEESFYVRGLASDQINNLHYLLIEAGSTKLYLLNRTAMSSYRNSLELPVRPGIEQNYPNPFNPSTTIRYAIPEKSRVTVEIYNTVGVLVDRLYEGTRDAGYFSQLWTPSVPSGMYFCRITVQSLEQSNNVSRNVTKMIYMK